MAMKTCVLVEWIGDEKPECWQVIKAADAFPRVNVEEISEGTVLDGIWQEDEETSPAKILKVHESKQYLLTVKENEYCKPWRSKVPAKRATSSPRTLDEYITNDNDSGDQISVTAQKKRKTDAKGVANQTQQNNKKQETKKKGSSEKSKKKGKTVRINEKGNEGGGEEEEGEETDPSFQSTEMKNSKDEAEKVLAAAILKKQRAMSPTIPSCDVPEHKQVKTTLEDLESDGEKDFQEINNQAKAYGLPKLKKNKNDECCRCCSKHDEQLKDLQQEISDLKRSMRKIRKTINEIRTNRDEATGESNSTTELEKTCREAVKNSTSLFVTVNYLLRKLYSKDEIISHSVSGKAANSKLAAKPKFDKRLELVKKIACDVHGTEQASQPKITAKIQAVQKAIKRELENKGR